MRVGIGVLVGCSESNKKRLWLLAWDIGSGKN